MTENKTAALNPAYEQAKSACHEIMTHLDLRCVPANYRPLIEVALTHAENDPDLCYRLIRKAHMATVPVAIRPLDAKDAANPMMCLEISLAARNDHIPPEEMMAVYPKPDDYTQEDYEEQIRGDLRRQRQAKLHVLTCNKDKKTLAEAKEQIPGFDNIDPEILGALGKANAEKKLDLFYVRGKPEKARRERTRSFELYDLRRLYRRTYAPGSENDRLSVGQSVAPWNRNFFFAVIGTISRTMAGKEENVRRLVTGFVCGYFCDRGESRNDRVVAFAFSPEAIDQLLGSNVEWMQTFDTAQQPVRRRRPAAAEGATTDGAPADELDELDVGNAAETAGGDTPHDPPNGAEDDAHSSDPSPGDMSGTPRLAASVAERLAAATN